MYRNLNIEILDAYLDIILEPLFKNKYNTVSIDTDISKFRDKRQLIISKMIKYPILVLSEEIILSSNEEEQYIKYCEEKIKELKRKQKIQDIIKIS